jgi:two-component system, OmpR family, sensor histidine kinase BaeS
VTTTRGGHRTGRLGLQLALAFVAVAIAAVGAAILIASVTLGGDEREILNLGYQRQTSAVASDAAAAYAHHGWGPALAPVLAGTRRTGAAIQVRNQDGAVVRSSPGFGSFRPKLVERAPVLVGGRRVGTVTERFSERGVAALVAQFNRRRWAVRSVAGLVGVLFALFVALIVAPRITAPLDRVLQAAYARGRGSRNARVGEVRGFRDVRQLAAAFDYMADSLGRQEQQRRDHEADIAHQLRTPVAVLQASTEAMLDGVTTMTPGSVASLHDETVKLARIVDDLQHLASAEAAALQLTLVRHDLASSAQVVADSLAEVFHRSGLALVRQLRPANAWCDPLKIQDVITNLLTNAAKFTPAGGTVELQTWARDGIAAVRVSDTGIGIRPDELPRVSERFFRSRRSAQLPGTGIGLAIVSELVRGHQGSLEISSEDGNGTQVTITLPAS